MKKLTITLTDKQHELILQEMRRCNEMNFEEETFSGMEFTLSATCSKIFASLDFKMLENIEVGEVDWNMI